MEKVKVILEQAMKAQNRSRDIALHVILPRHEMGVNITRHAVASLLPGKGPGALS
jgi:hypothetical protein